MKNFVRCATKLKRRLYYGQNYPQKKLSSLIDELPERKLEVLYDLARFLQSQRSHESQELFRMQMSSNAYQEWLGADNDIYDKVFKNAIAKR